MLVTSVEPLKDKQAAPAPAVGGAHHIPALDGLRGVAILMVLWFHYYGPIYKFCASPFDRFIVLTINTGWMGVDLFFALSGFLITGILLDAKGAPHYFRNFYARRALRIFPIYYGFLFVILIVIPRFHQYSPGLAQTVRDQAWLWLYGTNIATTFFPIKLAGFLHTWSLAVEEHFYLVWPAIVLVLNRRQLAVASLCIVVVALITRTLLVWRGLWPARRLRE